jgi:TRAP-type C4-dicarboxylate transport system permease large subunit
MSTVRTTAMIFLLMAAAQTLSVSTGYYGLPTMIETWALGIGSPMVLLLLVCLLYLVMGCFFDSMSMMLLTLPFVLPLLEAGGFDLVWFGIVAVITFEAGVITPPFGVNLFVLQGTTGERVEVIARGAVPFLVCMLVALIVVIGFPSVVLWLPGAMFG